jgi:dTDP-4-dehydrorhamnose 3,5-epimerase
MRFTPTEVDGVHVVDVEPYTDARGFFARAFCARELAEHGLESSFVQANMSGNVHAGTTRGLHWQDAATAPEAKLFRCIRGAVFVVAADMRAGSPTERLWTGAELTADNRRALYVPPGCATGYQALVDGAEVLYLVSGFYEPAAERGVRADDPALGIVWPLPPGPVSDKDAAWPLLEPSAAAG